MRAFAQITFFVLLSFGLHLLLLPLEFKSTAEPHSSGQIGINYVAKPLATFYPPAATPKKNSREVSNPPQKTPSVPSKISRHAESDDIPFVDEIKPASSQPVHQKDLTPPVPTLTKDVDSLTEKVVEKEEPVEPEPVNIATMQEPPPAEQDLEDEAGSSQQDLDTQSSKQTPVTIESLTGEDFSSSAVMVAQGGLANVQQKPDVSLNDQGNNVSGREFQDALPRYDINPAPHYPEVAKLRGWEGKVVFDAQIRKNGRVGRLKIKASSGYRSLDNAARKAVSRWKFSPATSFGMPKDSEVEIPITFSLTND